MATLTKEQIEAKNLQTEQLSDDELDEASGGSMSISHQQHTML